MATIEQLVRAIEKADDEARRWTEKYAAGGSIDCLSAAKIHLENASRMRRVLSSYNASDRRSAADALSDPRRVMVSRFIGGTAWER